MAATALTVLHKYIRREMFDMSQRLFRAGPTCVAAVRGALEEVAGLLHQHAEHEDKRFGPLLQRLDPQAAQRLSHEHERLAALLAEVLAAAAAIDPASAGCEAALQQLQLDWNRLVGLYLLHMDEEERTLFAHIGAQIPPVDYLAQSAAALGPQRGEEFLNKLWAVVTPTEMHAIERRRELRSVA